VCSGSDPSPIKPSSPLLCTIVVDFNVVPFDVSEVVNLDFKALAVAALALSRFSATCRNLERVSLEFHFPRRLDRFLVVVTGVFSVFFSVSGCSIP
jgi:hypothetical protein